MRNLLVVIFLVSISMGASAQISALSENEKYKLFKTKTEERIRDLETNIKIIGNKDHKNKLRKLAVNASVKYFESEEKIFEVSSLKNATRTYPIRQYLNRLKDLPYYQVEINWFNSKWVSDIRKGPNGKYYGTIRIVQVFKGKTADSQNEYTDKTTKDIDVEIDVLMLDLGEETKEVLVVKLGNVNVVETKKA